MTHGHLEKATPRDILRKYFGYDSFRSRQLDIIEGILDGRDAFVLMPTGSGKSICYQVPSLMLDGVGLVISPLIALMQDQVEALRQNGVRAEYLNSSLPPGEAGRVMARVRAGEADLLYVAPERLLSDHFQAFLGTVPVAIFAIDEAHCVSQWGHDFRPEYLQIAEVTRSFPGVPRMALTATADVVTRREILEKLEMPGAGQFISSFDRPNITYRVQQKHNGRKQLYSFIRDEHAAEAGIVYVRTRKRADETADWLEAHGVNALSYHAGLDQSTRGERQRRFLQEDGVVMVATIAFGMGIDKPDVRFVAHLDLPSSMEAYYQETGRAGRDDLPSDAWMVYSLADVVAMRKLLDLSEGDEAFKALRRRKLDSLLGFCETVECRRRVLLGYFGEEYSPPCGNCDNCMRAVETWDGTEAARKALSCVYRTGQRFGAAYLTDVLVGSRDPRISRFGHDRIKTFGVGADLSKTQWRSVFRQLLAAGLLTVNLAELSGFRLTERSRPVLKGDEKVRFRKDPTPVKQARTAPKTAEARPEITDDRSRSLWERLRSLRLEISRRLGLPPYVIFHDRTLKEMAMFRPMNREALLEINGVGERKADKYGELFLGVLRKDEHAEGPVT